MSDSAVAKIFRHGRSQAVRLPKAFPLPDDRVRVRVRRAASGILLEPLATDFEAWFAEVRLMEDGRRQPPVPERA